VLAGIVLSAQRSWLYRDERELWRAELAHNPASFRSWWGLGTSLLRKGDVQGAIEPLAKAHALLPTHFDTLRNYTEALVSLPDAAAEPERALEIAGKLAAASPLDPWARTLQAQAHLQAGRVGGGSDHFVAAEQLALSCLSIAAPKGYVYRLAAQARRGLGDLPGALAHLDASIERGLAPVGVRLDRAAVLRELGRPRDAQRELLVAQREAPGDPAVMQALLQLAAPPR
jgi:tetratricopeptide (TPR) repeat protein